ncbi:hypothetical protein SOVF_170950 [Spinacia oleracea]|nr:hypothetical protein SOVF_170950 [Spinacia oleracea]
MPLSSSYSAFALLFLLPALAVSTSDNVAVHHHDNGLKSMHFTLYQHDDLNKTAFLIVKGFAGPELNATVSPIGSIFVVRDPLTATPDSSSEVLGFVEAASITTSFDGLENLSIGKITLNLKGHKGSISSLGSVNNLKPSSVPVVGGTEDFFLVQGYLVMAIVDMKGYNLTYKLDFHLYWPPYAAQALNC